MNEQITSQLSQPGPFQHNWTLGFCTLTPSPYFFYFLFFLTDRPKRNARVREERIKALLVYEPKSLYTLNTNDCSVESLDHRSANPC